MSKWNPEEVGVHVRLRDKPGRQGITTGKIKQSGSFILVQVDFGPNEKEYKRYNQLELIEEHEEDESYFARKIFGDPMDLRRIITFEKIKGILTNVFYSMEASNTDFYPHQFKPVLRFIESPVGRLLLADEVGLGKTIEATFIWKEIQARNAARRLLIVCPSMLREKWKTDLKNKFNINSEICDAKNVLKRLEEISNQQSLDPFVMISSLEGLRTPSNFLDDNRTSSRIGKVLDENKVTEDFALFDCVIIDEAHYLRNSATASHRLGNLLRDSSRHLILLTATPIQIGSENLFQLLKLVDPDEFYDKRVFDAMLMANTSIVKAQRFLWNQSKDLKPIQRALKEARTSDYFKHDSVLKKIEQIIKNGLDNTRERMEVIRLLEGRSLLSHYMTRSRKREVLEERVERKPFVLRVEFCSEEEAIYDFVTKRIQNESKYLEGVSLFSLIMRQRQMASSIVGAIESWKEKELLTEYFDLDLVLPNSEEVNNLGNIVSQKIEDMESDVGFGVNFDLKKLIECDSKYKVLKEFLLKKLNENSKEKFLIFSFFRGTLNYLERRLSSEGIDCSLIHGSIKNKDEIIEHFSHTAGPSVLLSSDVGSEGLDLQFCRYLVNYDLPWNPMKLEQRIGRLDRLGQKSEIINIINLMVKDTIEDRILMRLYRRIEIFKESIGDLEDILGEISHKLILELLNPNLSFRERLRRSKEFELALQNRKEQQKELEREAVNLLGFSDYILNHISESRERGRWISGEHLRSLVDDYFKNQYPGTKIEFEIDKLIAKITLSDKARYDLEDFIAENRPAMHTSMHLSRKPVFACFDPRRIKTEKRHVEFIEPSHPLILWIRSHYVERMNQYHKVVALKIPKKLSTFEIGDYVFCTHRWSFEGLRTDHILAFSAFHINSKKDINLEKSERLVTSAINNGIPFTNAKNLIGDIDPFIIALHRCEKSLNDSFFKRSEAFQAENDVRCGQQETSAHKYANRLLGRFREQLESYRQNDRTDMIPMTEGRIRREEEQLEKKIRKINKFREINPTLVTLASGIVRVE